jgi:hypothetical protein
MTDKQKILGKTSTSVSTGAKAEDAKVAELSVKEVEDRLAFANAARCDIASDKVAE